MTNTTDTPQICPDISAQTLLTRYVLAGCSSIIIWDILGNLKNDYRLLFKYPIKHPTVVYVISRLSTLTHIVLGAVFDTAPLKNCNQLVRASHLFMTLAVSSTSLLFFFRVTAVYQGDRYVKTFFALLWVLVFVGFFVTLHGVAAQSEALLAVSTSYCMTTNLSHHVALDYVVPLVHDTLVFLAISWKLARNSLIQQSNLQYGVRVMVFGDYMPAFSRSLLQDGQIYYLTTISTGLLAFVMFMIPNGQDTFKATFIVPNIMLMNIMACHVFRKTKFGIFTENGMTTFSVTQTLPLAFDRETGLRST